MVQKFGLMHIKYWTSHFEKLENRRRKKYGCCCCCWSLDWWRWNGASIKSERVPSSLLHRLISSGPPHLLRPGWTVITFQTFAISNFWDPAHLFLASCHKSLVSGFGKISVQGPNVHWPICHQVHSLNWQNACSVIKLGCIYTSSDSQPSTFWLYSVIHRWKAIDLSFLMVFLKKYFVHPAKRQNFDDASGLKRNH